MDLREKSLLRFNALWMLRIAPATLGCGLQAAKIVTMRGRQSGTC